MKVQFTVQVGKNFKLAVSVAIPASLTIAILALLV